VPGAKVPCEKKNKREERKSLLRVVAGIFYRAMAVFSCLIEEGNDVNIE